MSIHLHNILLLAFVSAFISALLSGLLLTLYLSRLRGSNIDRRTAVLASLGVKNKRLVGFFHPYCNAGGGGERVLWTAIASIQKHEPEILSVVYSGDVEASKEQIIEKVKARFDITLEPKALHFVFLRSRYLVEDSTWPRFTLLGQSLGSMYLAWEAMTKLIPDLYIDTMGYAFTFPVVSVLGGIPVGAYVHYPTISTDMLARVKSRKSWHTNSDWISSSVILSQAKLLYYRLFMYHYSLCLRLASFRMVNSSWTQNHVDSILHHKDPLIDLIHLLSPCWVFVRLYLYLSQASTRVGNKSNATQIVYPPCPTREMSASALPGREKVILSIAQFRPEKDHKTQLLAFAELCNAHPQYRTGPQCVRLVLICGSRNDEDAARVEGLRALAKDLGIDTQTTFLVNAPYPEMLTWLAKASVGLNTMVDEHFGINVVEYMAAGVIPVVHASGGPLNDIVKPFRNGNTWYHATDVKTFASCIHSVFTLDPAEELALRSRARMCAIERFSEEGFEKSWDAALGEGGLRRWLAAS